MPTASKLKLRRFFAISSPVVVHRDISADSRLQLKTRLKALVFFRTYCNFLKFQSFTFPMNVVMAALQPSSSGALGLGSVVASLPCSQLQRLQLFVSCNTKQCLLESSRVDSSFTPVNAPVFRPFFFFFIHGIEVVLMSPRHPAVKSRGGRKKSSCGRLTQIPRRHVADVVFFL